MAGPALYVRAGGLVFLLLGALWVAVGLWSSLVLVVAAGAMVAVAGTVLLGLAPRIDDRSPE